MKELDEYLAEFDDFMKPVFLEFEKIRDEFFDEVQKIILGLEKENLSLKKEIEELKKLEKK